MTGSPLEWLVGGRVVSHFSRTAMFSRRAVLLASNIQIQRIAGSCTYPLMHHTRCHWRLMTFTLSDTGVTFTSRTYFFYRMKFFLNIRIPHFETSKDPLEALWTRIYSVVFQFVNGWFFDFVHFNTMWIWIPILFMNPFKWHSVEHFPPRITLRVSAESLSQALSYHEIEIGPVLRDIRSHTWYIITVRASGTPHGLRPAPKRSALELALRSRVDRSRPG